jgi:hypothetical protein
LFNSEWELIEAPSTFFVNQKSSPPNIIMSYFCVSCIDGSLESERVNKDHVHEWTLTRLRPKNSLEVQEIMYDLNEEIEASLEANGLLKIFVYVTT